MSENWVKMMDDDSAGNYMRFVENKPTTLTCLSDPERTVVKLSGKDVTRYSVKVREDGQTDEKIWSITARGLMQQLVALAGANHIDTLINVRLQIIGTGVGKERRWFVTLLK